jgi:hypothetical protein
MNYYFLCASLPELRPTALPEWSEETFLAACQDHLKSSDGASMAAFAAGTPSRGAFPAAWGDSEIQLRNAIARERGKRRQRDVSSIVRVHAGYDTILEIAVAEAFAARTPQERERLLDATRWKKAEELEAGDSFGMPHLFAYLIQLRIATRWGGHDQDEGVERIEALLNTDTDTDNPEEGLET